MTTAANAPLHTGGSAGHGADDTVDRGAAYRTRGLGGRLRGTTHCPTSSTNGVVNDTHDDSLMICC